MGSGAIKPPRLTEHQGWHTSQHSSITQAHPSINTEVTNTISPKISLQFLVLNSSATLRSATARNRGSDDDHYMSSSNPPSDGATVAVPVPVSGALGTGAESRDCLSISTVLQECTNQDQRCSALHCIAFIEISEH
jgi:hypothetical protein